MLGDALVFLQASPGSAAGVSSDMALVASKATPSGDGALCACLPSPWGPGLLSTLFIPLPAASKSPAPTKRPSASTRRACHPTSRYRGRWSARLHPQARHSPDPAAAPSQPCRPGQRSTGSWAGLETPSKIQHLAWKQQQAAGMWCLRGWGGTAGIWGENGRDQTPSFGKGRGCRGIFAALTALRTHPWPH